MANAIRAIDRLILPDSVTLLLEMDAGAGTTLGDEVGHMATVIDSTHHDLGVCLWIPRTRGRLDTIAVRGRV